ncbi:uncharacterized protein LOC104582742 [Brachypodium distachyon]|uniref:uncharacterized protein LOC104582742 n=1 Tax=Brachypodium distachyon TaxID=15368 RepID=UPI0001C7261D|nr:uncharacterized protein LOC104582742 [Brachypodium distachyon]|eukprot:XP_010231686.1 uncharacterized protein LOC104582742 [Brachypodium distachyon]
MGRKLPPFAPAGRKRKGPSFPTLSPCKLRRTTEASGWASLPTDLIHLVTSRLLSGDVVDYIPHEHGEAPPCAPPGPPRPTIQCTAAIRVLNPFTRDAVDLPSLGPVVHLVILCRLTMLNMNAAVCNSASSIAVVAWFPGTGVMLAAEPGRLNWEVLHKYVAFMSVLPYQGRLYATMADSREIMQLYPRSTHPVLAHVPNGFGEPMQCEFYLVESGGQVLLAVQYLTVAADPNSLQCFAYKVYTVDVDGRRPEPLSPVSSLGDRALFLSKHRCLSVSARDLPSVTGGSIYFSLFYHKDPSWFTRSGPA